MICIWQRIHFSYDLIIIYNIQCLIQHYERGQVIFWFASHLRLKWCSPSTESLSQKLHSQGYVRSFNPVAPWASHVNFRVQHDVKCFSFSGPLVFTSLYVIIFMSTLQTFSVQFWFNYSEKKVSVQFYLF